TRTEVDIFRREDDVPAGELLQLVGGFHFGERAGQGELRIAHVRGHRLEQRVGAVDADRRQHLLAIFSCMRGERHLSQLTTWVPASTRRPARKSPGSLNSPASHGISLRWRTLRTPTDPSATPAATDRSPSP